MLRSVVACTNRWFRAGIQPQLLGAAGCPAVGCSVDWWDQRQVLSDEPGGALSTLTLQCGCE